MTQQFEAEVSSEVEPWQRVHISTPVVRTGRGLIPIVILTLGSVRSGGSNQNNTNLFMHAIFVALAVIYGFIYWYSTRWRVEGGALRIETGVIRRNSLRFPLVQIQSVDIVRSGLARIFGVSELRLRMAGHNGAHDRLAFLKHEDAERVRARLLALAHGVYEHAAPPPETVLTSVRTNRLVWSLVLSPLGYLIILAIVSIAVVGIVAGINQMFATIGGLVPFGVIIGVRFWRRLNGGYHLTVAEAPDGLRLRGGLLQTTAETIPRGRVQAVRLSEPWIWRRLGWCKLHVIVAGEQHLRGENTDEGRSSRLILPVGDHNDVQLLLDQIVPDAPTGPTSRPPARVRLKAPLSYHHLGWQRNKTCAKTTHGRLKKVTDWTPMSKVQSIRVLQGPIQRRLRVANIHLDNAGRDVHAELTDRSEEEIASLVEELIENARANRVLARRSQ